MFKKKKGRRAVVQPHYDRPKRYFLKKGLIRRMFDVTQLFHVNISCLSTFP